MTTGDFDRLTKILRLVSAILERSLHGDYADLELADPVWPVLLDAMTEALGLPPGWDVAELDQAVARLREVAPR